MQAYKESGVDLEAGYESVRRIKNHVERTKVRGAMDSLGAFGGMFDLAALGIREPVLVSGTDGVGTKLMLAFMLDIHDTIGQDAVAMCVNDVLVQGAYPLFFLDYLAVGKNDPARIEALVKGVADGCVLAECALIGGETAEMPDMYEENHYDIAGFCVGVAEKSALITGKDVAPGDVLIGLASSGLHSNGFSLVRKILFKDAHFDVNACYPELGSTQTLGEVLLTPTRIYVKALKALFGKVRVHGMSHITGGGFYENIPRMLPAGCKAVLDTRRISLPPIFSLLMHSAQLPREEMYNVFNMGIGFVIALNPADVDTSLEILRAAGEEPLVLGHIEAGEGVELLW